MIEKIEDRGVEVQGIEVIDLGDAAEETRQWHPVQAVQDSATTWGRPFFD
jgi:hypothetical protein